MKDRKSKAVRNEQHGEDGETGDAGSSVATMDLTGLVNAKRENQKKYEAVWSALKGRPSGERNSNGRFCIIKSAAKRQNDVVRPLITDCQFSPTGDELVLIDEAGKVFSMRTAGGQLRFVRDFHAKGKRLNFASNVPREIIVALANKSLVCLDIDSPPVDEYGINFLAHPHKHIVHQVRYHPTWNLAVSASTDKLCLWDTTSWTRKKILGGGTGIVDTSFTPRGDLLLVAFREPCIIGWGVSSLEVMVRLVPRIPLDHPHLTINSSCCSLTCFAVSPDSRFVVAGAKGPFLFVWQLSSQILLRIVELPSSVTCITQLEFLPENSHSVVALGDDGVVRVVQVVGSDQSNIIQEIYDDSGAFLRFALSPTEELLAGCVSNGTLSLHDLEAGKRHQKRATAWKKRMGVANDDNENRLLASYASFLPIDEELENQREGEEAEEEEEQEQEQEENQEPASSVHRAKPELVSKKNSFESEKGDDDSADFTIDEISDSVDKIKRNRNNAKKRQQTSNPTVYERQGKEKELELKLELELEQEQEDLQQMNEPPLLRLARSLKNEESQLNRHKLEKMIKFFGEFPDKYRTIIWRYLLGLPENSDAYSTLVSKGPNQSWNDLYVKFPVKNPKTFARFERVLFALSNWCPLFGEISYLPALAFPFVKVFGIDELAAFETVMTVLFRACGDWFESFPHAPVLILARIEKLVEQTDRHLLEHFVERGISSEIYAWNMLRSLYSEVLSKDEWLKLWDNILMCLSSKPFFLEALCVSYLRYFRNTLMSLKRKSDFENFFRRPNPLDIRRWLKSSKKLYAQMKTFWQRFENHQSIDGCHEEFLLPRGETYPAFNKYPSFSVDYEAQEREKIRMEEEALLRRKNYVEEIRSKTLALEAQEREQIRMQENLLKMEEENRRRHSEQEKRRLEEMERVEKLTRLRRLEKVEKLEQLARDNLSLQQQLRQAELRRQQQELDHQAKIRELELQSRQEEEKVLSLESDASLKLKKMHAQRQLEQELQSVRLDKTRMTKQAELDWKMKEEAWRLEDEKMKIAREMLLERSERETLIKEVALSKMEMDTKFASQQAESHKKLSEMERQRQIRKFKEDTSVENDKNLQRRLDLERTLAEQEKLERQTVLAEYESWTNKIAGEREKILGEERRKMLQESQDRDERIANLIRLKAKRDFEQQTAKSMAETHTKIVEEEQKLQSQLLSLDEQRRAERNSELELLLKEKQLAERTEFLRVARAAEENAIQDERKRFQDLRLQLAQMREEEEKRRMNDLLQAQEKDSGDTKVLESAARARQRAHDEEATRFAVE